MNPKMIGELNQWKRAIKQVFAWFGVKLWPEPVKSELQVRIEASRARVKESQDSMLKQMLDNFGLDSLEMDDLLYFAPGAEIKVHFVDELGQRWFLEQLGDDLTFRIGWFSAETLIPILRRALYIKRWNSKFDNLLHLNAKQDVADAVEKYTQMMQNFESNSSGDIPVFQSGHINMLGAADLEELREKIKHTYQGPGHGHTIILQQGIERIN